MRPDKSSRWYFGFLLKWLWLWLPPLVFSGVFAAVSGFVFGAAMVCVYVVIYGGIYLLHLALPVLDKFSEQLMDDDGRLPLPNTGDLLKLNAGSKGYHS